MAASEQPGEILTEGKDLRQQKALGARNGNQVG